MPLEPIDPRLLDHLVVEFRDHGQRAVGFLHTAHRLFQLDPTFAPRLPETIAYCLREAMKTLLASEQIGSPDSWRKVSRTVSAARERYELVRNMPGEDGEGALEGLLAAIDDLERFHSQQGIHEGRLIAIILKRTGTRPLTGGTDPVRAYQDVLRDLDGALHGETTWDDAHEFWERSLRMLKQCFLPPEMRFLELDALAESESPTQSDVERLGVLISGPTHLSYFMGRISSIRWLELLTPTGLLDPSASADPWPVFAAVDRLAPENGSALTEWLDSFYARVSAEAQNASYVTRAALSVGADAVGVVLRALRDHDASSAIAAMGIGMVAKLDSTSKAVEALADLLLNERTWKAAVYLDPVVEALIGGADESNIGRRLELLCWKLKADSGSDGFHWRRSYGAGGSIADPPEDAERDERFPVLVHALAETIRCARAWMSTDDILAAVDSLPVELRARFRTWVLSEAADVDVGRLIDEVATAVAERDPTGDDLPILDRVCEEANPEDFAMIWELALGPAPTVAEVSRRLASRSMPHDWFQVYHWVGVLPESATGKWQRAADVIAGRYGRPGRDALETRNEVRGGFVGSPMSTEELAALPLQEAAARVAAWRRGPSDWLVGARELARTLEAAVAEDARWLETPVPIATSLRHPMYIHHYLRGVATAIKNGQCPPIDETLDVIDMVREHPWDAEPLGNDSYDYDLDWSGATEAGVALVKAMADADAGFGGRDDAVWTLLDEEARDRTRPSGISGERDDPLTSAINRPCTRALDAALSFMAYEFRLTKSVRKDALELLEDALRVVGQSGAEHRAIIVTRLAFLRHIASKWVDNTAELIFGDAAPGDLGQITADLAIRWGQPNQWFLERYRPLLRDAVTRRVENALPHMLVGMLQEADGYGVSETILFLDDDPELLSSAGEQLGRLLRRGDVEKAQITCALAFWDAANSIGRADVLAGFGWFAEVSELDSGLWATRTLTTLEVTDGQIDWSHRVLERAASLPPSKTTLAIINSLVRGTTDEWNRRGGIERAVAHLRAAEELSDTDEYQRLRTTLLERGAKL